MANMYEFWARVGVSFEVSEQELSYWKMLAPTEQRHFLLELIQSDRATLNGETYFPSAELDATDPLYFDSNDAWSPNEDFSPRPLHKNAAPFIFPPVNNATGLRSAKEVASSQPNEALDKACAAVMRVIERAASEQKHRTLFDPRPDELYLAVRRTFEQLGYQFEPIGTEGGVRQIGEYICW